jgi:hypothetical protein
LQGDLAGGVDGERRQRGAGTVLGWLRFPRGGRGASLGQADSACLASTVYDLHEIEPNKRSAQLERDDIAQCRSARVVFVAARPRLASQTRRCSRERRTEQPRVPRGKTQRQTLQRHPSRGDHSNLRVSQGRQ